MQPQVLGQPHQPVAEIPPLPEEADERAVNVIQLGSKGKEKVMEPEIITIKRAAAKKEAKQAVSEQQQQALKAHKHTLMQTRMDEMYGVKKGGKKGGLSGGMSSGVNERGQLVWEG